MVTSAVRLGACSHPVVQIRIKLTTQPVFYVRSSIAIILMGKRELVALLNLSSWCLVMVERLFLVVPRGCLQFVIVVFPDHTYLLFLAVPANTNQQTFKLLASLSS